MAPVQLRASLLVRSHRLLCQLAVSCVPDLPLSDNAVDIICLCDRSGSMQGNKLRQLRTALDSLLAGISARDRLAVLTFNDDVQVIQSLEFMTPGAKEELALKLNVALERGFGSTHLYECMEHATRLLEQDETPQRQTGVIVLTDGQDSTRSAQGVMSHVAARLMASYEAQARHLFFMALGNDHNRQLMEALHEAGATAIYLQTETQLATVYHRVYSLLKRLLPCEVKLLVSLQDFPAVPMPRLLTNHVPRVGPASDGRPGCSLEFPLRNFAQAGEAPDEVSETRSVLLEWSFDSEEVARRHASGSLGSASVLYKDLLAGGSEYTSLPWIPLASSQDPAEITEAERQIAVEEIRLETRQVAQDLVQGRGAENLVERIALLRRRSTEAEEGSPEGLSMVQTMLQELENTVQTPGLTSATTTAQAQDFVRQLDAQRCISAPSSDRN